MDNRELSLNALKTLLEQFPSVKEAALIFWNDTLGNEQLAAYVVPDFGAKSRSLPLEEEQLSIWQSSYDNLYDEPGDHPPAFDFRGWTSSYNREPIPPEEMREWHAAVLARIFSLSPERVLEFGMGTGLLLQQIAPVVEAYWATDLSDRALDLLEKRLEADPCAFKNVVMLPQSKSIVEELPVDYFDTILLNSVVQYFPSVFYLLDILKLLVAILRPGGRIYLGDIRNFELLRSFKASVERSKLQLDCNPAHFEHAVGRSVMMEKELLLSPQFFAGLEHAIDGLGGVDIQLKRARSVNELTQYRYEVILHKKPVEATSLRHVPQIIWDPQLWDLKRLKNTLRAEMPTALRVLHVRNGRLFSKPSAPMVLASTETSCGMQSQESGLLPEEFESLANESGYDAIVTWSEPSKPEYFDVIILRGKARKDALSGVYLADASKPLECYANDPSLFLKAETLIKECRHLLMRHLPRHFNAVEVVLVEQLPRTSDGKLDPAGLPRPNHGSAT